MHLVRLTVTKTHCHIRTRNMKICGTASPTTEQRPRILAVTFYIITHSCYPASIVSWEHYASLRACTQKPKVVKPGHAMLLFGETLKSHLYKTQSAPLKTAPLPIRVFLSGFTGMEHQPLLLLPAQAPTCPRWPTASLCYKAALPSFP